MWLVVGLLLLMAATNAAQAKVQITYTSWQSSGVGREVEEEIVRRFNESQSEIEVTFVPGPWSQALLEQLIVQVASGVAPDVATLRGVTVGSALQQMAIDLTPFIERDQFSLDRFLPGSLNLATRDGKIYGFPWALNTMNLYYNRSLFQEAGLPDPQKGWTTSEFEEYARRLTVDKQGDGEIDQWGLDHLHDGHLYLWGQLFGGSFLTEDGTAVAIQEPEFITALEWAQKLVISDQSVRLSPQGDNQFAAGRSGMVANWEAYVGTLTTQQVHENFEWGMTYMPRGGNAPTLNYGQWHVMAILRTTKHPEAAWEFLKFYYSDEIQRLLGERSVEPATIVGRRTFGLEGPLPPGAARTTIYGPVLDPPETRTVAWEVPGMADIWPEMVAMFATVLRGEENPRTAVERIVPSLNLRLAEARSK